MTALLGAGRIEAHDIEQYRETTPPWDVIPRQMSPGRFFGLTEYLQVNGILIYREHWSKRTVVQGASPPGFFMIGGPSRPGTHIDWYGTQLSAQSLAHGWDSSEVDFIIPDNCDHWVVLVPIDLARRLLAQESQTNEPPRNGRHWGCDPESGNALNRLVHRLIDNTWHMVNYWAMRWNAKPSSRNCWRPWQRWCTQVRTTG